MQNCSVRPWDVRATRTKREIWKSGDAGHLERLPGQHPSPRGGVCVVSAVGPSKDPARASTCSHPCLRFLVSCALLSVCPAPTPGLSGPIKHQRHVFSPSLRPLDPGSLSFLPVLHCPHLTTTFNEDAIELQAKRNYFIIAICIYSAFQLL